MPTGAIGVGTRIPSSTAWAGQPAIRGRSESVRMAYLTASIVGVQFTWGVEMSYCTPYLLQLGMAKSLVSLVWIAGPLSGLIMQPVVGILADRSTSPWGRRRPFMVGGAVVVSVLLMILGWAEELVSLFVSNQDLKRKVTITLAVLCIYAIDFAINSVQASGRSLIVDVLPTSKQQLGSAWATRMVAVGSLIGYGAGALDLEAIFGTALGDTQFKQLIVVAAIALLTCTGITCWAVSEKVLVDDGEPRPGNGAVDILAQMVRTTTNLPPRISAICWVQFWAWIGNANGYTGWFPFLFYSTTWVGEIYKRYDVPAGAQQSADALGQIGRLGSLSLIIFSTITFIGSVALPSLVRTPDDEKPEFTPRPPPGLAGVFEVYEKNKPSLLTAWTISHIIFTCTMILAPLANSFRYATTIVAICGIPWAVACWAPFTLMGVEINRLAGAGYRRVSGSDMEMAGGESSKGGAQGTTSSGELSGVYLGILNLFTTIPQFIGTMISWAVFSMLEPGKSPELAKEAHPSEHHPKDGPNAIAVCLFIGALSTGVAAYATNWLRRLE
ncbi:sucrose transporter [Phyllosticta capitalensis]|uniref:Sucrose transporter n=1 Tax=Phyllosticta capitalensis TaxID=121624 RepID=A0ABR1Z2Z3_9PEZI